MAVDRLVLVAALTAIGWVSPAAAQRVVRGDCSLTIDGKSYVNLKRRCRIDLHGDGGFSINTLDEDEPVPVRFVAAFDNAVLGHRDRTRILPEAHRTTVMPGYSMVHATVLVDGFVAATWTIDE